MPRQSVFSLRMGLVAVLLYFAAVLLGWPLVGSILKTIPMLVLIGWLRAVPTRDAQLVSLGLVLSLVGDICLSPAVNLFIPGLVAFLLAHVVYVVAYLGRTKALHLLRLLPMAAFCYVGFRWLEPNLGEMRGPVLAYVIVIGTMMWRAAAQIGERPGAEGQAWAALIGAVLFAASDLLVAYTKFVAPSLSLHLTLMALYWGAQVLIASSVERPR